MTVTIGSMKCFGSCEKTNNGDKKYPLFNECLASVAKHLDHEVAELGGLNYILLLSRLRRSIR